MIGLISNPCDNEKYGIQLQAVQNSMFVAVNGADVKVWTKYDKMKWGISNQFNYQSLKVI